MKIQPLADYPKINVHSYKWPQRATNNTCAYLIGEDSIGKWIGVATGDAWWAADNSQSGVFLGPLVKVFPANTFWTACFYPGDFSIDVDISMPVRWVEDRVEEIDLELDVLYSTRGGITVRDQAKFDDILDTYGLPPEIARRAQDTCKQICGMIERGDEPFGTVGFTWLEHFLKAVRLDTPT